MTIRHLKKYLFFFVAAIKMMYFLAFTKEFDIQCNKTQTWNEHI